MQAGDCHVWPLLQGAEHIHPPWEILKLTVFFHKGDKQGSSVS